MNINKEIRRAAETGKAVFGTEQTEKSILKGVAELIIVSSNTQRQTRERIEQLSNVNQVPVYYFNGTGTSLGSACGKPFKVSVLSVQDPGKSNLMDAVQEESKGK